MDSVDGPSGGAGSTIVLTGEVAAQIPPIGFVEVLEGQTPNGLPVYQDTVVRASTWGYAGVTQGGGFTTLYNIYGGGLDGAALNITSADTHVAVLRRLTSPSDTSGRMATDYQHDVTYGAAKRAKSLRFEDSEVIPNLDGSVSIRGRQTLANSQQELFADLFSCWLLEGGVLDIGAATHDGVGNTWTIPYSAYTILWEGKRLELPAGQVTVPDVGTFYLHLTAGETASDCHIWTYSAALPLASRNLILMHKVITTIPAITGNLDLRYPLEDVDQRVDIYVGNVRGLQTETPHFTTLADAIDYANEIQTPDVGTAGRHIRIRIVGYTEETRTPITIRTNGLIVEGVPRTTSGAGIWSEIRWDGGAGANTALINLNGFDDLIFRGLTFRCTTDPGHGNATPATCQRPVFTCTNLAHPSSDRIVIENNRVLGLAQGLVGIQNAGELSNSLIARNHCPEVLDFGVFINNAATAAVGPGMVIRENYFLLNVATSGTMVAGGIEIRGTAGGQALRIEDNFVSGTFDWGLILDPITASGEITGNYILGSLTVGLVVRNGSHVRVAENWLSAIYQQAVVLPAYKAGLLIGPGAMVTVDHNYVSLQDHPTGIDNDIEVEAAGTTDMLVTRNKAQVIQVGSPQSVTRDNVATDLKVGGANMVVAGNALATLVTSAANGRIQGNRLTGNATLQATAGSCHLSGNRIEGTLLVQSDYCLIENSWTQTGIVSGVSCAVTGSFFETLALGYNAAGPAFFGGSVNHRLTNCRIGTARGSACYLSDFAIASSCEFYGLLYVTHSCTVQGSSIYWLRDYVDNHPALIAINVTVGACQIAHVGWSGAVEEGILGLTQ